MRSEMIHIREVFRVDPLYRYCQNMARVIQLRNGKVKNIEQWITEWKMALTLPPYYRTQVEEAILTGAKDIKFTSKAGHCLFNAGICGSLFTQPLGRNAMWLGVKVMADAIGRKRKEDVNKEFVMRKIIDTLDPTDGQEDFSREDKRCLELLLAR